MSSLFLILFPHYLSASLSSRGISYIVNQTPSEWGDLWRNETVQQKKRKMLYVSFIFRMVTLISELLKRNTCILKFSIQGITVIIQFTYARKCKAKSILWIIFNTTVVGPWCWGLDFFCPCAVLWVSSTRSCLWTRRIQIEAYTVVRISQGYHCKLDWVLCKTNTKYFSQNFYNFFICTYVHI